MDQAGRQRQPLFPSAGQLSGELLLPAAQSEILDAGLHHGAALLDAIHARDEIEILHDAQILPEAESLRHVADLPLDLLALPDDVVTQAGAAAFVRHQQTAQHADESGLAAAVGTEEAVDFAGAHLQIDVVHHRAIIEPFGHAFDIDGEIA